MQSRDNKRKQSNVPTDREESDMNINPVIELCLQRAREAGLPDPKQNDVAAEVLRKLRPEWSDSQIADSINRVLGSLHGERVYG